MDHNISLIATVAAGFGVALVLGFIAERIRLSALVGYLLAGVVIGPHTPGFVADAHIASQLSEIGIMLLMFGVGLHFAPEDLFAVKRVAVPGALLQMGVVSGIGLFLGWSWEWSLGGCLVYGLCMACASTVVVLKAMEARAQLVTMNGRIAVGWLVVQDLIAVIVLVLLPPLAGLLGATAPASTSDQPLWVTLGITLCQVIGFLALMFIVGKRVLPKMLWQVARTGSRELFTLAVIASAISIAFGASALFNVSFALGAFIAGTVMRESEFSHRAAEQTLPLRDAFSVLFFVSVGMLFKPTTLIEQPIAVLLTVIVIVFGNFLVATSLVLALRYPLNTALRVGASLGQIGEFSIILAGLGASLGLLPPEGMSLIVAGVIISIAMNSFLFTSVNPLREWALKKSALARRLEHRQDPFAELPMTTEQRFLEGQVVLVGYGRVGQRVASALDLRGIPYVVVEQCRDIVEGLRRKGLAAVVGDATEAGVLVQAHIMKAAMLLVATPDPLNMRHMADIARTLNPTIEIVLRTQSEEESGLLLDEKIGAVFYAEDELAKNMAVYVQERFKPRDSLIQQDDCGLQRVGSNKDSSVSNHRKVG